MKKIITLLLLIMLAMLFIISPVISIYREYFSVEKYNQMYGAKTFVDIFYEPKSKKCEIYDIGGFGYIDLEIIKDNPNEKAFYVKNSYKIFDEKTISKLMNLLRECKFLPIERKEAFKLSLLFDENNAVTSLGISSKWFDDEYNSLFSEKIVEEINEQCDRISSCTIFFVGEDLYLMGVCPTRIMGSSYSKYEKPDFSETVTVMFELEMSESAQKVLDLKDEFYPGHNKLWMLE